MCVFFLNNYTKARVREAWGHTRSLLLLDPSPLATSQPLHSLVELLSLPAQPRPLAPGLVVGLLVNTAVLSEEPIGRVSEVVQTVRKRAHGDVEDVVT